MRILYLMQGTGISGGTRVVWAHCIELAKRGHEMVYGVLDFPVEEMTWLPGNVPVKHLSEVLAQPWDVVVATGWKTWPRVHNSFSRAKSKWGFAQMKESLFLGPPYPNAADKAFSLKGFKVLTISAWLKDYLEQDCGQQGVKIIPNGVDTNLFYPEPSLELKSKKKGRPVALIVGHQISPDAKNISDAVQAICMAGNFTIWHICPFFPTCREQVGADWIFVTPPQEQLRQIYSTADILVMSSKAEGRSCIPVEAMACKLPVVIMDHKGIEDSQDGRALIAEPGNVEQLARLIRYTMDNPEKTKAQAEKAYKYVHRELRWEDIGAQLERLYSEEA